MSLKTLEIAGRQIGPGNPCYVIAEAGSNHNGSLDTAKELVDRAVEARADAIKFQAFKASQHYSKFTPNFTYLEEAGSDQTTFDLIRSLEIDREWHPELVEYCRQKGITFLSSPCDKDAVDQLAGLGMPAFKVASFDLPDLGLIRSIARYGRPIIMSTGLADFVDIQSAVRAAAEEGNDQVILLQCTSLYPAPPELSNLRAMDTMKRAFGGPVGYSDHTEGDHICLAAVALGASIVEKHFTLDRRMVGPDHSFAIEPQDLELMIRRIRDVESSFGDGMKDGPRPAEQEMFEKGRRSIHTTRDLRAGEVITHDALCVKRPGYGIAPRFIDSIVGLTLKKDLPADHWVRWDALK
ncbi:MAG: N-acetylneuraminate synthase family protein [Acidobacteria bacterium]|nr:N-acetylneuraminate synthase family protein [Acidobacteriota bacterium]